MTSIRDLPIRQKIVAIIMIVSAAALILASSVLITYDFITARRDLRASATTIARIVAANSTAAVSFNDPKAAVEILHSIRAEPSIVAACVYTPMGLFAEYRASGQAPCPREAVENDFEGEYLHVESPIELNGKELGTVHLRATMAPMYARLRLEGMAIVMVLLFAALFAFVLSSRLHKFISLPVLSLARAAKAVSDRKDYSIRAVKHSQDELGGLADAFNEMLSQIEARDSELRQRTGELLKANRAKDEFLATLSHELRTPLNSILGWSILVQEGRLSDERERTAFQAIERNARLQSRLIEDLLDVSRIISGKFTLDLSHIALKPIVEGAIEVTRPIAETKHIRVQAYWDPEALHVNGDGARLQQAIWNLLSNAVKFTGENGSVEVRLEKSEGRARISVSDNGIGIGEEFLPYVFDRFRQADASSTRAFGGLGLGLAIVRHIVEMHGGSVRAESKGKTHGATFTIELPLLTTPSNSEEASLRSSLRD